MDSVLAFRALKLIHIFSIILVAGGSITVAMLAKNLSSATGGWAAGLKNIGRMVMVGFVLAIASGLTLVFTYSRIAHPIFDIKMTFLLIALILGGYINHGVMPKLMATGGGDETKLNKFVSLQRITTLLILVVVVLGVFMT
jgi:hypothetical protein